MNDLFTGYEIARLISYNAIKEGTYLQQYIDGEQCETDGIYVIHNKNLYSTKPFLDEKSLRLLPNKESVVSLLCSKDIEFRIIEHICEQCGLPILDKKTREEFHGCCSGRCEKEMIRTIKIPQMIKEIEESTGFSMKELAFIDEQLSKMIKNIFK